MTAPTHNHPRPNLAPARPSWKRLSLLASVLLLGWALLLPACQQARWWHILLAVTLVVAFVGSWHGQHLSTAVRRWTPMAWRNHRRQRPSRPKRSPAPRRDEDASTAGAHKAAALQARIVIHLRPHPHTLTTVSDNADQLPWEFITAWLDRYGVRADALTACSLTRTPPTSALRSDAAPLVTGRTPQHRDTWLTYTLRAESNVGALTARQTTIASTDADAADDAGPRPAALADTTARRLIAELRERGWLATLCDAPQQLPRFVPPAATVRRELWTATEYSDGFRAVYAVEPEALSAVLTALPTLATKTTWVAVTMRSHGRQPATIEACVATLTATRPQLQPLPGLAGFHGLHRRIGPALTATGLDDVDVPPPTAALDSVDVSELTWHTAPFGVPIGFNRARQPVYLGLASPEPVRITVTGQRDFHMGMTARLALSGLPIAVYTADLQRWVSLANHAAPQQFWLGPQTPPPGAIIVSDHDRPEPAGGAITVRLRRPQSAAAPSTTIVTTQDDRHPNLFHISTPHGAQWLSTRLSWTRP